MSEEVLEVPEIAAQPAPVLLNLDTPRVIALKSRSGEFRYKTRRVTLKDWETCFHGIVDQSLRVDGERQRVYDANGALVELADRVLVSSDDGVHRSFKEPKLLPISHRVAIGSILQTASILDSPDEDLCDLVTVKLGAIWSIDGESQAFSGLIHRFRHPALEDLKRFRFEASRVRVRGEGRNSVSIYPSRLAIAMRIYDDLIESVDGYAVAGVPLAKKEDIAREMDGAHKAVAALALFEQDDEVTVK